MTQSPDVRVLTEGNAKATYVAAVDEAGAPIPGKHAKVIFNSDGEPVNIVLETN